MWYLCFSVMPCGWPHQFGWPGHRGTGNDTKIEMSCTCGLLNGVVVFSVVKAVWKGDVVSVMLMCHVMTEDVCLWWWFIDLWSGHNWIFLWFLQSRLRGGGSDVSLHPVPAFCHTWGEAASKDRLNLISVCCTGPFKSCLRRMQSKSRHPLPRSGASVMWVCMLSTIFVFGHFELYWLKNRRQLKAVVVSRLLFSAIGKHQTPHVPDLESGGCLMFCFMFFSCTWISTKLSLICGCWNDASAEQSSKPCDGDDVMWWLWLCMWWSCVASEI